MSQDINNTPSAVNYPKINIILMAILNFVYSLSHITRVTSVIFLGCLVYCAYTYMTRLPSFSIPKRYRFTGVTYLLNSLLFLVIGIDVGNYSRILTVIIVLILYIAFLMIVLGVALHHKKGATEKVTKEIRPSVNIAKGTLIGTSATGLLISRSLDNTVSQDTKMLTVSIAAIGLAFLLSNGVKYLLMSDDM